MLSVTGQHLATRQAPPQVAESVDALAAFDQAAWRALFERYHRKLYSFAYVRTGDTSAAEEIAADVFVAAARGIAKYQQRGAPLASWLFRIARNLTADHLDQRRRRPVVSADTLDLPSGDWGGAIEDATDIASALSTLTGAQQEVLTLRFFGGCSLEETAGAMGKRVGAVKVLQHRALASMRRELRRGDH